MRFAFDAAALGKATINFVATAAGGAAASDKVQLTVPVEAKQGEVYVATSFAVRPSNNGTSGRNEGLALPASDGNVGSVQLVAGAWW